MLMVSSVLHFYLHFIVLPFYLLTELEAFTFQFRSVANVYLLAAGEQ